MSGGHFYYCGLRIRDALGEIARDSVVEDRFPRLSRVLLDLGAVLYGLEHDLDWDLSGDHAIEDDKVFQEHALYRLRAALDTGPPKKRRDVDYLIGVLMEHDFSRTAPTGGLLSWRAGDITVNMEYVEECCREGQHDRAYSTLQEALQLYYSKTAPPG